MATRLEIAREDIFGLFDGLDHTVLSKRDISEILTNNRSAWRLAVRTNVREFLEFLSKRGKLKRIDLVSPNYPNFSTERYIWDRASQHEIALSLRKNAYLCHGSAAYLHGLTDLLPKQIYINVEQSEKPQSSGLTQRGIELAFSRKQRTSRFVYDLEESEVVIVNGKNTKRLGVEKVMIDGTKVDCTEVERTLIDVVVRPAYAGGIYQVKEIYKAAKDRVSVNRLHATLKKLNYTYPYHQSIGFLMEQTGYRDSKIEIFRRIPSEFNFYLTHGMSDPDFDPNWKLFFPKGF